MATLPPHFRRCEHRWMCPTSGVSYGVAFAIDTQLADRIERNFGLRGRTSSKGNNEFSLSPTDSRQLSAHGIILDGAHIRVDYASIARASSDVLRPITEHLLGQVGTANGIRERVAAVVGLSQSLGYDLPEISAGGAIKFGFRTPLAVLVRGSGDCDSRVCLAAAMLKATELIDTAIIMGNSHAMLGVAVPTKSGDAVVGLGGRSFVIVECTGLFRLGFCDANDLTAGKSYRPIPL